YAVFPSQSDVDEFETPRRSETVHTAVPAREPLLRGFAGSVPELRGASGPAGCWEPTRARRRSVLPRSLSPCAAAVSEFDQCGAFGEQTWVMCLAGTRIWLSAPPRENSNQTVRAFHRNPTGNSWRAHSSNHGRVQPYLVSRTLT